MYVESVTLENLKGFKNLSFDFKRPDNTYAGWTVFVGGNSSGKSTLLKGIALALMGPDAGKQLLESTEGWIHGEEKKASAQLVLTFDGSDKFKTRGSVPQTSFEAGVRWGFDGKESQIPYFRVLDNRHSGSRSQPATRGPWNADSKGWYSSGYGPMRRLSGNSVESIRFSTKVGAVSRFVTLFREDAALSESEAWLKTIHSRNLEKQNKDMDELLEGVKALLSDNLLPNNMKISQITVDHVLVKEEGGRELPMRDISDGCRSIYATILDLVHGMYEVYGINNLFKIEDNGHIVVDRPGVVIIDEIEAHLHPSWQREIPEWFKKHFPKVQFLVTTHSPLVAQAADPNGVFVLPSQFDKNQEPRRLETDEFEKLRLGQADKTLLGVAFGLKTSRSQWATQQIGQYKRLNAKNREGVKLTKTEERDFKELQQKMSLVFEPANETESL